MPASTAEQRYDFAATARRDLHVHTPYCGHAAGSMEEYVRAAIDRQLDEVGFLAHVESGVTGCKKPSWLSEDELDSYWREGCELADRYASRIKVSLGVEVGINPDAMEGLSALLARHAFARVGMSYHYLRRPTDRAQLNICSPRQMATCRLNEAELVTLNQHYYITLRQAVAELRPTFVCHLDVPRRHLDDVGLHPKIAPRIIELLTTMRTTGTALEINTAGYDHRPGGEEHAYPARWILVEALRRDVQVVLCSDSHAPDQVGRHFARAVDDCETALSSAHKPPMLF